MPSPLDLAQLAARRPVLAAALLAGASALAAWGVLGDHDPVRRVDPDALQPARETLEELESVFAGQGNELLLLVEGEDLFDGPGAAAWRQLEREAEALPGVDQLLTPDDVPSAPFDRAAARAHPLVGGQLLSADGDAWLLPTVLSPADGYWPPRVMGPLRQAAARASADGAATVTVTGTLPTFTEMGLALDRDRERFLVIAAGLAFVLASLIFRSLAATVIAGAAPLVGVLWTYGVLGLLGEWLNPLTAAVLPILVMMIAFTDAVHVVLFARRERAAGAPPREAAASAARHLALPCLLTSVTTAVGFGSLMLADSEVIRRFGFACAIGAACGFLAVMLFVPAMLATPLGARLGRPRDGAVMQRLRARGVALVDGAARNSGRVSLAGALVTALLIAASAAVLRADNRIAQDLPRDNDAYSAMVRADEAGEGVQLLNVLVEWDEDVDAVAVLAAIADVEAALAAAPDVARPLSVRALLASVPGELDEVARLSLLTFVPERLVRTLWQPDARRARVSGRVRDLGVRHYGPIYADLAADLDRRGAAHAGVSLRLTGGPLVYGAHVERLVGDLVLSLGVASAILFAMLALTFRSLRVGLMAVVPNLFPLAVTAGLLTALGESLELASVCAFVICLGIAVDDTIHFLTRFGHELRACGDVREALRRAFLTVGNALVVTTLILLSGFGSVLTSELPGNRVFAAMACTTIGAALLGDLLVLPAILARFARRGDFGAGPRSR